MDKDNLIQLLESYLRDGWSGDVECIGSEDLPQLVEDILKLNERKEFTLDEMSSNISDLFRSIKKSVKLNYINYMIDDVKLEIETYNKYGVVYRGATEDKLNFLLDRLNRQKEMITIISADDNDVDEI